ncbi:MAG TPA: c-type cytochrome domain-containing protein, partial [Verrucomicrobium sp.]|nr:c-type cytochrome domain-containing protein [Verrucomicrobium sp.]
MRIPCALLLCLAPWLLLSPALANTATGGVAPKPAEAMGLLKTHCLGCHGAEKQKGGLSLETRDAAIKGGESGTSLIPGKGGNSALIKALTVEGDGHMPPKKQLPAKQIALLRVWVDGGALWDEKALAAFGEPAPAEKLTPLPHGPQPVVALALSPDGTRLAASHGNVVELRDVSQPTRPVVARFTGHKDVVQSLAWSADGTKLAAGVYRLVKVWKVADGAEIASWSAPLEGRIPALAFLPDHSTLVIADGAAAQRGLLHYWKLGAASPEHTWEAHQDNIVSLVLSADGLLLASGGADNVARVWNTADRKLVGKFEGHAGPVMGVAFNKDGSWLATGSADKELKVWDVKTKEQLVQLSKANTPITALYWTSDGQRLISINEEGLPRIYREFKVHEG